MTTDELNRLLGRGLDVSIAFDIINGSRDEEFEVAQQMESKKAREWAAKRENIPQALTPRWDLDPSNFHLVLDGARPNSIKNFSVVDADVPDVMHNLTAIDRLDADPWSSGFVAKSAGTAYRWKNSMPVTPPMLVPHGDRVVIPDGKHRFRLAIHYNVTRMPFLVEGADLQNTLKILTTARLR